MMDLPKALEQLFKQEAEQIELERTMPYVTSIERLAKQEAQVEMLLLALERQYRVTMPEEIVARIRETTDPEILKRWFGMVFEAKSFEEFQQRIQP